MRRVIGALVLLAVVALQAGLGATVCLLGTGCAGTRSPIGEEDRPRRFSPMVMDKATGHYKDMSYEALSDEGLSWEEKTRLFGGETVTYGPLTAEQRKAKQKELKELLAKIDMKLVKKCEADIRAWLDERAAAPLKKEGWEKDYTKDWSIYTHVTLAHLNTGTAVLFRAYEIWGDKKYLEAGLKRLEVFLRDQTPRGNWSQNRINDGRYARIQDRFQDQPSTILLYAYKLTGDKKYFESAKRCADLLLTLQRPDSGGWGDQWCFDGAPRVKTGVVYGTSHNDSATTAQFVLMVMMYNITGDRKYIANLHKLGKHIEDANIGEGDVVGWSEQYNDGATPVRARQYEIEICYPSSLNRSMGPLLTWLYLMDGNEKHMELMKRAYNTLERIRRKDLEPENWKCWKALKDAGGRAAWYHPGLPHAFLPDASNMGGVTHYGMYAYYPVTAEQRKKWGRFIHKNTGGDLYQWAEKVKAGETPPGKFGGAGAGNAFCQVRRTLLEHKRGGREGLLKYYTGPVKYTPDQYLQARVDAAKRALDKRNVRLASMHDRGIRSVATCAGLAGAKGRWYGPKESKWGKAYDDYVVRQGKWPGHAAWYQWQLVYDTMIAQGKIDADKAARGGRGLEDWMGSHTHLDSWDVMGQYNMHFQERENHFDVPLGVNAPAISGRSRFLGKAAVVIDCFETNGAIRYTLDGSEPTERSRKYRKPITVKKTTTVKARFFRTGGAKSAVVEQAFTRVEPRKHKGMTLVPGLRYDYYEGRWEALPDFAKLTPAASGTVGAVTLAPRQREEGFAFRFTGYLDVKAAGRYTFHLGSDDGSRLTVDGKVVVDNDGLHGFVRRSGAVDLKPGMHEAVITFFERTGVQKLAATYQGPGISRRPMVFWRRR